MQRHFSNPACIDDDGEMDDDLDAYIYIYIYIRPYKDT